MSKGLTRRRALAQGMAGFTVVAGGGLVWRAWDRGVFSVGAGPAYELWRTWRTDQQRGPMAIVQAGILAANAHNTQPWRFDVRPDRITLAADNGRHLGPFDPYRREMYLSLGCALENMIQTAAAQGLQASVAPVPGRLDLTEPNAESTIVATLHLVDGEAPRASLAGAITRRHTNRGAYDRNRVLSADQIAAMHALAKGSGAEPRLRLFDTDPQQRQLGDLIVAATEAIIADPEMAAASAAWFRFDPSEIAAHRDGVTLDAVGLPPLTNAVAKVLPAPSENAAHAQWLEATRERHVGTAPLLGIIETSDPYDIPQALAAGRLWQRLHLWAAANGVAAHPLNQPAEMVDRERALGRPPETAEALAGVLGTTGRQPTFVFRMGYSETPARPSPRRSANAVVKA